MANIFITPLVFTRGVLMNLGGYLNVARNLSSEYKKEFGSKVQKIGATFQVRKPQRFEGTTNVAYTPEPLANIFTTITVDKTFGIHFDWNSIDKTLSIEQANERYFKPAALRIAHRHNADAADFAFYNTFNTVGLPGVNPGAGSQDIPTLLGYYMGAGDKLVQQGLPENEAMNCIISRKMSSVFVGRVSSLFTPTEEIGKQYQTGWKDPTGLGYRWYKDQGLHVHTGGSSLGTVPLVSGNNQTGPDGNNSSGTLLMKGLASSTTIAKKGDWFTIDGVYSVHPIYKTTTGELQQFKLLQDLTSSGTTGTASFFPAITPTGQYQNVDAAPVDGAAIYFDMGTLASPTLYASAVSRCALLLHKNAHAYVSVPLEGPEKGMGSITEMQTDPDTGVTMRFTHSWDAILSREITRIDTLYGFGWLYREMACVILGQN